MMATLDHPLIAAYFARLEAVTSGLAPERRAELRADLEEHLRDALTESDGSDEAVREMLDRLGPPEDLAAEAGAGAAHTEPPQRNGTPVLEFIALGLMLIGLIGTLTISFAFIAPLFSIAGIVLGLFSTRWRPSDKALAVLAYGVLGPTIIILTFALLAFRQECTSSSDSLGNITEVCVGGPPGWLVTVAWIGLVLLVALWIYTGVRLYRQAVAGVGQRSSGVVVGLLFLAVLVAVLFVVIWLFMIFGLGRM